MRAIAFCLLLAGPFLLKPLRACKCANRGPTSACDVFSAAGAVFIGRIESVERGFDPWDMAFRRRLEERFTKAELDNLNDDKSPEGLQKLKEVWLDFFSEPYKTALVKVKTFDELYALMDSIEQKGRRARFQVLQVFRGKLEKTAEVRTEVSDCGYPFEKGETYLVYADIDDEHGLKTGACSHTRKLADAAEDMVYLYLSQNGKAAANRVSGLVTSSESDLRRARDWGSVEHPVQDVVIEVQSATGLRYARTDASGKFGIDGLTEGEYAVSVFDSDYPDEFHLLDGPRKIAIQEGRCSNEVFLVHPTDRR
jgi:hypothetical protein